MFHQLLTQATEVVRTKLLASAKLEQKDIIKRVMDEISTQVVKSPLVPHDYAKAERAIAALSQDTNLMRTKIAEFADTKHVAEVIVGLTSVNGLQVDQVERLFYAPTCFGTYGFVQGQRIGMENNLCSHQGACS